MFLRLLDKTTCKPTWQAFIQTDEFRLPETLYDALRKSGSKPTWLDIMFGIKPDNSQFQRSTLFYWSGRAGGRFVKLRSFWNPFEVRILFPEGCKIEPDQWPNIVDSLQQPAKECKSPFSPDMTWYRTRDEAEEHMHEHLPHYENVCFIGISHYHLVEHLKKSLDKIPEPGESKCVWKEITVVYPPAALGNKWKPSGQDFDADMRTSRKAVADMLTDSAILNVFKSPPRVTFIQSRHFLGLTGCFMERDPVSEEQADQRIYYVVQSCPLGDKQDRTENQITFEIRSDDGKGSMNLATDKMLIHFERCLTFLRQQSIWLGEFVWTPWDDSASSWAAFSQRTPATYSILKVIDFLSLKPGLKLLDLGCGTGELANAIRERNRDVDIMCLDGSPQMLVQARKAIQVERNVHFALQKIGFDTRTQESENAIDLMSNDGDVSRYDRIVMHNTLIAVAPKAHSVEMLAQWCKRHLTQDGFVVVSLHNGLARLPDSSIEGCDQDPFRKTLLRLAAQSGFKKANRPQQPKLSVDDITSGFSKAGFSLDRQNPFQVEFTIEDRAAMWMCPAVFASLVEYRCGSAQRVQDLVTAAARESGSKGAKPRQVMLLKFVQDHASSDRG